MHAEVQNAQRAAELAHINRFNVAGELTATIAHELSQPLGAVLANSEAAKTLLKSPAPNMEELREILTDIQRDDQRARSYCECHGRDVRRAACETQGYRHYNARR
jgi:signal transduction histidine kinase